MKNFFSLLILFLLLTTCRTGPAGLYHYQPPEQLADGIEVASLGTVGLDTLLLTLAAEKVISGKYKEVHSILIYKDGKLVFEEYFPGHQYQWDGPRHYGAFIDWHPDSLHHIMSDTKSITSACIGIAVNQGFIKSVDDSVFDYLPESYQYLKTDAKAKITIEHLLTMTNGLEGNEWTAPYSSGENPVIALWIPPCEDPVTCVLEKPLLREPGTHFSYFGGNQIVLGKVIEQATGMQIDSFSMRYLFEPLGIQEADWAMRFANGTIEAAGGLKLRPRDMLKVGILFLQEGEWKGQRIISEDWVEKSKQAYQDNKGIKVPGTTIRNVSYGYSWWLMPLEVNGLAVNMFYAGGWGGQNIMVLPEVNTVIVFTGGNYTSKPPEFKIMKKYILPAFG